MGGTTRRWSRRLDKIIIIIKDLQQHTGTGIIGEKRLKDGSSEKLVWEWANANGIVCSVYKQWHR